MPAGARESGATVNSPGTPVLDFSTELRDTRERSRLLASCAIGVQRRADAATHLKGIVERGPT